MISSRTGSLLMLMITGVVARPEPPVQQYLPPSQQYGPPQSNPEGYPGQGQFGGSNQYLPPNQQYGPPFGPGTGGYNENYPPAQYNFEYMVNDPPTRSDFGHKETRNGDMTRGVYYVLLPDGRRQTVEYEVDQHGYRPKVTYSQEGPAFGSGTSAGYPPSSGGYPPSNTGYFY